MRRLFFSVLAFVALAAASCTEHGGGGNGTGSGSGFPPKLLTRESVDEDGTKILYMENAYNERGDTLLKSKYVRGALVERARYTYDYDNRRCDIVHEFTAGDGSHSAVEWIEYLDAGMTKPKIRMYADYLVYTYDYDEAGRLKKVVQKFNGTERLTSVYEYDGHGRLVHERTEILSELYNETFYDYDMRTKTAYQDNALSSVPYRVVREYLDTDLKYMDKITVYSNYDYDSHVETEKEYVRQTGQIEYDDRMRVVGNTSIVYNVAGDKTEYIWYGNYRYDGNKVTYDYLIGGYRGGVVEDSYFDNVVHYTDVYTSEL